MIKIWDLWIRLFHWSLAITVGFLLISGETGLGFFDYHQLAGEIALGLILFRLLWGFVGSSNARLVSLLVHPRLAIAHLRSLLRRSPHQERGHNAAGGWAVIALLLLILVQAVTGLFIADEEGWVEGALYGQVSTELSDTLYNIHHTVAGVLQLLVIVHIAMIAVYFLVGRQNLLKPMITGNMQWTDDSDPPAVRFGSVVAAVLCAVVAFGCVALLVNWI